MVCPQCGGNDLTPFGYMAYKCQACGTILKDEPEEKPVTPPPATHYTAPLSSFDDDNTYERNRFDDDDEATKKLVGIVVLAIIFIGALCLYFFSSDKPASPVQTNYISPLDSSLLPENIIGKDYLDGLKKGMDSLKAASVPDTNAKPSREERGIEIKNISVFADGKSNNGLSLVTDQQIKISLKKPVGFKKKGNLVFVGISFSLISPGETELYNSGDINETAGAKGEDFTHYQKSCDITFTISDVFGFDGRGNYKLKYRVWDKKSSNELNGEIPLFVEK